MSLNFTLCPSELLNAPLLPSFTPTPSYLSFFLSLSLPHLLFSSPLILSHLVSFLPHPMPSSLFLPPVPLKAARLMNVVKDSAEGRCKR